MKGDLGELRCLRFQLEGEGRALPRRPPPSSRGEGTDTEGRAGTVGDTRRPHTRRSWKQQGGGKPTCELYPTGKDLFHQLLQPGSGCRTEYHLGVEFRTRCLAALTCKQAG